MLIYRRCIVGAFLVLAGCTGLPVGYGGAPQVTYEDPNKITIEYSGVTEGFQGIQATADRHCAKTGRKAKARPLQKDTSYWLITVKSYTFDCVY